MENTAINQETPERRISYIDEMKGFAILCVVIGHMPHSYIEHGIAGGAAAKILLDIMNVIYVFHMPLFMMISGYLYNKAYFARKQDNKKRLYGQVGNLLGIYVISNIGYAVLKMIGGGGSGLFSEVSLTDVLLIWIKPVYGITWYLYVLAIYYIAFSSEALNRADPKIVLAVLLISSIISSFTRIDWFKLSNIFYFAIFFYIGILHSKRKGYIIGNRPVVICMSAIALVLVVVFWDRAPFSGIEQAFRVEEIPVVKMLVGLGSSLLLWEIFESAKLPKSKFLQILGKSSLEIYVIHQVVISVVCVAIKQLGIDSVILNALITLTLSISIPMAFSQICRLLGIHDLIFKPCTYFLKRKKQKSV